MKLSDWWRPDWNAGGKVHNWRNYVSEEVRAMWDTFNDDQKKALYRQANDSAEREEWD
jgi:hypothetical protein